MRGLFFFFCFVQATNIPITMIVYMEFDGNIFIDSQGRIDRTYSGI